MQQQEQWLEEPFNNVCNLDYATRMGKPDIGLPIELEMMGQRFAKRYAKGGMRGQLGSFVASPGDLGTFDGSMGGLMVAREAPRMAWSLLLVDSMVIMMV